MDKIAVDEHKGVIIASYVTNNPTEYNELIPLMEEIKSNTVEYTLNAF